MPETRKFLQPDEEEVITLLDRLAQIHFQNAGAWWRGDEYVKQQTNHYMSACRLKIAILAACRRIYG